MTFSKVESKHLIQAEDFKSIKDHIYYGFDNELKSKNKLKDVIHDICLDLYRVYYVYDQAQENYVVINKQYLKKWNISEEKLRALADKNVQAKPVEITKRDKEDTYTMKLKGLKFGACALYNIKEIKKFADEKQADLLIVPSSIREIIVVVNRVQFDFIKEVDQIIALEGELFESNLRLPPREVLSFNVYGYSRKTNKIQIL